MTDISDPPRLILPTPPRGDLDAVAAALPAALATGRVAAVRLDLPGAAEPEIRRAADRLRPICHEADVPLILRDHAALAAPLGLDGVQVAARGANLRKLRADLGRDRVLGVAVGASKHDAMTAAELGADYVLFHPVSAAAALGGEAVTEPELLEWWSETIETPCAAEGGLDDAMAAALGEALDFAVPDPTIWEAEGGLVAALTALDAALRGR